MRWTGCRFLIALCFFTVVAQVETPAIPGSGCAKTKVRLSSEELRSRITHREPLHIPETNMLIAPDAVLRFKIVISTDGTVDCLSVEQGHPVLTSLAIASVKDWRFRRLGLGGKAFPYSGTLVLKGADFSP
jgi:hypothetical protein